MTPQRQLIIAGTVGTILGGWLMTPVLWLILTYMHLIAPISWIVPALLVLLGMREGDRTGQAAYVRWRLRQLRKHEREYRRQREAYYDHLGQAIRELRKAREQARQQPDQEDQ